MLRLMNLTVWAVLLLMLAGLIAVGHYFGLAAMMFLVLGWGGSTAMWQMAHKSRYGHYFGSPVVNGDELDSRKIGRRAPDVT